MKTEPSYFPDPERFAKDLAVSSLLPVSREILADLDTPLTLFAKVARTRKEVFLFESMEGGEKWGRFSFIGYGPLLSFSAKARAVTIERVEGERRKTETFDANPLDALKAMVEELNAAEYDELPRFCGGAVGFLGYDMVRFMEELPATNPPSSFPDCCFMVPEVVLVHDSFRQTVTVVAWSRVKEGQEAGDLYAHATGVVEKAIAEIRRPVDQELFCGKSKEEQLGQFEANMEPGQFHEMVERAKEYIRAGDIFQVVLSQRFHAKTTLSPLALYRALRHINPSPYLFFLQFGDLIQIGSSPEILVRKTGDAVELRPIAGTRPRGVDVEEDLALEKELLADPKECAEHLMLVDLGRNDVGRVAAGGQVRVDDLMVIERYSHVMHIVSGVHGEIAADKDQFDVVSACFPAGTVSGAPKIRAMEIIDELEPDSRGPYAGSVGYFGFSGNMDFCIAIRTFTMLGEDLWIQAGAGIVADSDPQNEYQETVNKSMGLRRAVELAKRGF